jgi:hypothetical protein
MKDTKTITKIEHHACEMCAVMHAFITFSDGSKINMPSDKVRCLDAGDVVAINEDGELEYIGRVE